MLGLQTLPRNSWFPVIIQVVHSCGKRFPTVHLPVLYTRCIYMAPLCKAFVSFTKALLFFFLKSCKGTSCPPHQFTWRDFETNIESWRPWNMWDGIGASAFLHLEFRSPFLHCLNLSVEIAFWSWDMSSGRHRPRPHIGFFFFPLKSQTCFFGKKWHVPWQIKVMTSWDLFHRHQPRGRPKISLLQAFVHSDWRID